VVSAVKSTLYSSLRLLNMTSYLGISYTKIATRQHFYGIANQVPEVFFSRHRILASISGYPLLATLVLCNHVCVIKNKRHSLYQTFIFIKYYNSLYPREYFDHRLSPCLFIRLPSIIAFNSRCTVFSLQSVTISEMSLIVASPFASMIV
jgi:hypothetical protein